MIVWGGYDGSDLVGTGGVYDPTTDTWTPTSTTNAPTGRYGHTAAWAGSKMIVWGGVTIGSGAVDTGGIYDPTTDTWTPTSTTNSPTARYLHTTVWAGSRMIVWGGQGDFGHVNTGGAYDPTTDTWTPMSSTNAPTGRHLHTAVWTGSKMIIWGGYQDYWPTNTGGIYEPTTDTWTATATSRAPAGRYYHTAVWTGSRMVVWGGDEDSKYTDTGGICDLTQLTAALGDFNGDENPDLLFRSSPTGDLAVWYMDGQGWSTDGVKKTGGAALSAKPGSTVWVPVGVADFNNDGSLDVLFRHELSGDLVVWYMDGVTRTGGAPLSARPGSTSWMPVGIADFNADHKPDVLFRHQPTGDLVVWYMDGVTRTGGAALSAKPGSTDWVPVGVADFDADGKPDILFRHEPSGEHVVWYLNGVTRTGGAALSPAGPLDTRWRVVALADYNLYGGTDIVWQYEPTGDLAVWFMHGVTMWSGAATSPPRATPPWQVVAPQ